MPVSAENRSAYKKDRAARHAQAPTTSPAYRHLPMEDVRMLRALLDAERTSAGYCARVLRTRIDALAEDLGAPLSASLGRALDQAGIDEDRLSLLPGSRPRPAVDPAWAWQTAATMPGDAAYTLLQRAETAALDYEQALGVRHAEVTVEMLGRYHAEPLLALDLLPEPLRDFYLVNVAERLA